MIVLRAFSAVILMSQEEGGTPVITPLEVRKTATKRSRCEDYASAVADVLKKDEELESLSCSLTRIQTSSRRRKYWVCCTHK